jgi:predicted acylesterase/phospholipase RssA
VRLTKRHLQFVAAFLGVLFLLPADAGAQSPRQQRCPGHVRALVLGGGGIRGAYQAGAIWYLVNIAGCHFEKFVGTSTGAVAAGLLAQAQDHSELRTLVDVLVANYESLATKSDIVGRGDVGLLLVFLPRWLGGTDGVYTLAPTQKLLEQYLRRPLRNNLAVTAVSLQCGYDCVKSMKPHEDSTLDYILGSASIPFFIEPRRVRFWTPAKVLSLEADELVVTHKYAGLPDKKCQLRFKDEPPLQCEHRGTIEDPDRNIEIDRSAWWRTTIRLVGLTSETRRALVQSLAPSNSSSAGTDPFVDVAQPRRVEFTVVHQLVDGGVAANLPIERMLDEFAADHVLGPVDTAFILSTTESRNDDETKEYRGGIAVLMRSLTHLWDEYQFTSVWAATNRALFGSSTFRAHKWIDEAYQWLLSLEPLIPRHRWTELTDPDREEGPKWPGDPEPLLRYTLAPTFSTPDLYFVVPETNFFKDSSALAVDQSVVQQALHQGCIYAARIIHLPESVAKGVYGLPSSGVMRVRDLAPCKRFAPAPGSSSSRAPDDVTAAQGHELAEPARPEQASSRP